MRTGFIGFVLLFVAVPALQAQEQRPEEYITAFYAAFSAIDSQAISRQLSVLDAATFKEKDAYRGALLMKQSGGQRQPKAKMRLFKTGRDLLEQALREEPHNAEYRFLRLAIQEHAPRLLNYHNRLEEDRAIILQAFPQLPLGLQQAILRYCETSEWLDAEAF